MQIKKSDVLEAFNTTSNDAEMASKLGLSKAAAIKARKAFGLTRRSANVVYVDDVSETPDKVQTSPIMDAQTMPEPTIESTPTEQTPW